MQGHWDTGRGDLRGPTLEEFRNMTFQAICAESCMLDCFAWSGSIKVKPNPGMTAEEHLQMIVDVYAEVQFLEPIILSVEPAPYYEVVAGDWFVHMTKRHEGKSYLFAVNTAGAIGLKKTASVNIAAVLPADPEGPGL